MATPEQPHVRVTPAGPRKPTRKRSRNGGGDDDDDGRLRGELLELILRMSRMPASTLFFMLTEAGAFLQPERFERRLRADGREFEANQFRRALHTPAFWKTLTQRCFPNIKRLPIIIVERRRANRYPGNNDVERDNAMWADALRYISTVLSNVYVTSSQGGTTRGNEKFSPTLRLDEDPLARCSDYVNVEHTAHRRYTVDPSNDDGGTAYHFGFTVSVSETADGDGFGSDDEIDFEMDDFPSVGALNRSGEATFARMMTKQGVLVHRSDPLFPYIYSQLFNVNYELHWSITNSVGLEATFDSTSPDLVTRVDARFSVHPWELDDRMLWGIGLRQKNPLALSCGELLPVLVTINRRIGEQMDLVARYRLDVPAKTHIMCSGEFNDYQGDDNCIFSSIRDVYRGTLHELPPPGNSTAWRLDHDWLEDEDEPAVLEFPLGYGEITYGTLGEYIGPPRPSRPALEGQVASTWYEGSVFDAAGQQRVINVICRFVVD
jgi:hypothetical protein